MADSVRRLTVNQEYVSSNLTVPVTRAGGIRRDAIDLKSIEARPHPSSNLGRGIFCKRKDIGSNPMRVAGAFSRRSREGGWLVSSG